MLATSPIPQDADSPVSVTIFGLDDATIPPDLTDRLRREVLDARRTSGSPPHCELPTAAVALVYLSSGTSLDILARVVDWSGRGAAPVALMGCCPDGTQDDTEAALAAGFDDFVVTSISARELAGRVRALARRIRRPAPGSERGRFGRISLDVARYQVLVGDHQATLTPTELQVMQVLVSAQGRTVTRTEILEAVRGDDSFEIGERSVDNVVMRLRRKLGDRDLIVTVRGIGFRLASARTGAASQSGQDR